MRDSVDSFLSAIGLMGRCFSNNSLRLKELSTILGLELILETENRSSLLVGKQVDLVGRQLQNLHDELK